MSLSYEGIEPVLETQVCALDNLLFDAELENYLKSKDHMFHG